MVGVLHATQEAMQGATPPFGEVSYITAVIRRTKTDPIAGEGWPARQDRPRPLA